MLPPEPRHEAAAQDAAHPTDDTEPSPNNRVISPLNHELRIGGNPDWPTIFCSCGWSTTSRGWSRTQAVFEHGWSVGYDTGINL